MNTKITIEEIARKLKPIFGEAIDKIYFKYVTSESLEEKNEISQLLSALYQKNLSKLLEQGILLEPPEENIIKAEYALSPVSYAGKKLHLFGLREKDWPRHVCITGMSGSGKTTFAFSVLKNFIEKEKPFLVFDWKKSFRPLMNLDNSIMLFTVGNKEVSNYFKMNINIPPKGVNPKEWINVLCDLLTESFQVSFGVHKILLETLDEAFEGWGVYEGGKHYPNWKHIKRLLEQKAKDSKGRETGWYESALRVATVLTFGEFGEVINYEGKRNLSIEDLFDKRVILELNSLSNVEKKFFAEYILTYIYKLKKIQENKINQEFNYAILVDEAHNVFLKNKTYFVSESVTDLVYREMREYGISLICLDQHVSKLSDSVTGNSACHVMFQQQLPEDIRDASQIMQLEQRKDIFSKLSVGQAIVKLSERYTSPFLIEVPFVDLRKHTLPDLELKSKMKAIISGVEVEKHDPEFLKEITNINEFPREKNPKVEFIPNKKEESLEPETIEIAQFPKKNSSKKDLNEKEKILFEFIKRYKEKNYDLNEIERILEKGVSAGYYSSLEVMNSMNFFLGENLKVPLKKEKKISFSFIEDKINEEEKKFLNFLSQNPDHNLSTVELYKKIGLSPRKGNVIKDGLLNKNLIKVQEEKHDRGWKKLIMLNK